MGRLQVRLRSKRPRFSTLPSREASSAWSLPSTCKKIHYSPCIKLNSGRPSFVQDLLQMCYSQALLVKKFKNHLICDCLHWHGVALATYCIVLTIQYLSGNCKQRQVWKSKNVMRIPTPLYLLETKPADTCLSPCPLYISAPSS